MNGYVSKFDRAKRIVNAWGYVEGTVEYDRVLRQIFAKLLVNWKTIGKRCGKLYVE